MLQSRFPRESGGPRSVAPTNGGHGAALPASAQDLGEDLRELARVDRACCEGVYVFSCLSTLVKEALFLPTRLGTGKADRPLAGVAVDHEVRHAASGKTET